MEGAFCLPGLVGSNPLLLSTIKSPIPPVGTPIPPVPKVDLAGTPGATVPQTIPNRWKLGKSPQIKLGKKALFVLIGDIIGLAEIEPD